MQNPPPGSYPPPQGYSPGGYQPGGYPPPGPPAGKTKTLNLDYNVAAGLGYLPVCLINPILPIIMLVTEPKENKFVRFHAMQALFLLGGYIVSIIVVAILVTVLTIVGAMMSETLGAILGLVGGLLYFAVIIAFLALSVIGIIKAWGGNIWRAPIVGSLADKNS